MSASFLPRHDIGEGETFGISESMCRRQRPQVLKQQESVNRQTDSCQVKYLLWFLLKDLTPVESAQRQLQWLSGLNWSFTCNSAVTAWNIPVPSVVEPRPSVKAKWWLFLARHCGLKTDDLRVLSWRLQEVVQWPQRGCMIRKMWRVQAKYRQSV